MIDDLTKDDFDKYVTPATPKRQREFRTDRNNNPIAAAVTTGGRNQFTDALDQAEIPWEHGDPFPGNPKLSTIRIKGDPIEGARAILSNSNALKWYRSTTGKTVLPKYGVRSSADFTKLPTDRQDEIINGIYQSEGGSGKIKPVIDDFDKYVTSGAQTAPQPEDDFEKYVTPQPQQPLSAATDGMQGQQPREKVSVEAKPVEFQGATPQPLDTALPTAKPIPFQQGTGGYTPPTLNPLENVYNLAGNEQPSGSLQQQLEQRRLREQESGRLKLGGPAGAPFSYEEGKPIEGTQSGQRVKLSFSSHLNPSPQDVEEAYVKALGPEYEEYNKMHVAQTGQNLVSFKPDQLAQIKREPDGSFYVSPRKDALDYLNAYVTSGGDLDKANQVADVNRQAQFQAAKTAQEGAKSDAAEVEAARKSEGTEGSITGMVPGTMEPVSISGRAITGPTERLIAGIGKTIGGLSSLGGLTPNQFSDYMNRSSEITQLQASLPPLTAEGKEIQKNVPEKVATALADLGLTVAQLAITKKVTGLPLGAIMAAETALKTSDEPNQAKRALEIGKNGALGSVLEAHLGRAMASAIFATPTAVEGAQAKLRKPEERPWTDVLLDTAIQGGIGAAMGGSKSEGLTDLGIEKAPAAGVPGEATTTTNINQRLAEREAKVQPTFLRDDQGNPVARVLNPDEVAEGAKPKVRLVHHSDTQARDEAGKFAEPSTIPQAPVEAAPTVAGPRSTAEEIAQALEGRRGLPPEVEAQYRKAAEKEARDRVAAVQPAQVERRGPDRLTDEEYQAKLKEAGVGQGTPPEQLGQIGKPAEAEAPKLFFSDGTEVERTGEMRVPDEGEYYLLGNRVMKGSRAGDPSDPVREILIPKTDAPTPAAPAEESILDKRPWEVTLKELEGRWSREQHRKDVEAAIRQGYDVPKAVQAEYPDLFPTPQEAPKIAETKGEPKDAGTEVASGPAQIIKAAGAGEKPAPISTTPKEPEFVRAARERAAQRAAEKQQGIEYRHAGVDPRELVDSLIVRGWEIYDQKVKPTFQEWSRKLREEFGPKAEEHLRGVWAKVSNEKPSEESTTAAMKAKVDEDRAARGAEPLPWKPETKADEDLLSEANRRALANPREAQQLTAEVLKKPRALSDVETVQLDVHKQELVNDHNQILQAIAETNDPEKLTQQSARLDAIEQEFDDTDQAWRLSGTEKGRSLRAQRITINQNYELLPMKARMKAATGETKLPPEVEAKIEAQQKRIAELEARWNKRVAAKEEKARTESIDKTIIEKKIEIRRAGRQRSRAALVAERADLKQQVAQAWAKMKPKTTTLSMGGLGDIDPQGELTRALGNLARNYIEDGVVKAADLVDVIHEQIKDVADLTKRQVSDLISGYGKTRASVVDPVEKKLNEVKSILASTSGTADVLEKGTRPLRRGQQREKPTEDQRRALRELEDAMREKGPELATQPYDVKTEQATPLDKAKTTARNRQEQLQKWISDGKREVQGRQQVIPDAELNRLKAENVALEKAVALLDDPTADQKAIERRMGELQRMIGKQRANIQTGNTSLGVKEGAKSTWSPEIGAMEKERRALMSIANDMRADAARKAKEAEAAKPIGVYGVEGSWADFEARAKKALAARKRFESQIADMQRRRAAGDFEKTPKAEPLIHDPDTERLRLEMNREKRKFDADVFNAKIKKEWNERPLWSKGMAYGAAGVRASVLSGVKTLGKIGSALVQRTGQQYGEEGAARIAKPFVRGTAEKATRYGGHMNVESEKAFAKGFAAGVKEIPNIIRTGESELSSRFSDHYPGIPTKAGRALEVPGRFHFAEKNPLMRGEFERYKELALQEAERKNPGARNDPAVIDAVEERAYKSAKEVILMGDNPFSRMVTGAQRSLSLAQRDMVRTIVPVHRVAGNYLNQAINEYGLGIFRGAIRALHERNPDALAKLTPEEADKTMRLLQRGTLGVIYMALAGTGIGDVAGVKFGGFYKRGRKDEVQPQDVKVGKVTIPHWALHSPPDELAQLTASMKQEWDEGKQREETRGQRFASGAARSVKGVLRQTPFVNELTQVTNSLDSGDSISGWAGRFIASRIEPQVVQEIAKTTDRYQGQDVKRKPRGFTDALKMGLPGARQTVPISPVFGSQASKASNEVQRLDMALNGAVKKSDESRQEFAERQPLVNGYIRRALEKEVATSDYQNDSDPNKIERLKQVKEAAEKEGQAAYDAIPRPQKFKKQKQVYQVPSGAPQSLLKPWLPPRNPFKTGSEAFKA